MQAPSPTNALDDEVRKKGERRASYKYRQTIGDFGLTTCICDFGCPVCLLRGDDGDVSQARAPERIDKSHEALACGVGQAEPSAAALGYAAMVFSCTSVITRCC